MFDLSMKLKSHSMSTDFEDFAWGLISVEDVHIDFEVDYRIMFWVFGHYGLFVETFKP